MGEALKAAGGNVRLTIYPASEHVHHTADAAFPVHGNPNGPDVACGL